MSGRVRPGLCSVTFRALGPDDVVALAVEARLDGIEWAGDVHVPPGDTSVAESVGARCRDAELATVSYGSYLTARTSPDDQSPHGEPTAHEVDAVLDVALALGARTVRVWAGTRGSTDTDADGRRRVADQLRSWTTSATALGLDLGLEYHAGTLTDTIDSTLALLADVDHPGLRSYWQPRDVHEGEPDDDRDLAELDAVADTGRLGHLHVFSWRTWFERHELAWRSELWRRAVHRASVGSVTDGAPRFAYLEFVAGDDPERFLADARQLRSWTRSA